MTWSVLLQLESLTQYTFVTIRVVNSIHQLVQLESLTQYTDLSQRLSILTL